MEDGHRRQGISTSEDSYRGVGAAPRAGVGAFPNRGVGVAPREGVDAAPKDRENIFNINSFNGGVGTAPRGVEEVSNHGHEGGRCRAGRVARR